jgi:hypothetical protein
MQVLLILLAITALLLWGIRGYGLQKKARSRTPATSAPISANAVPKVADAQAPASIASDVQFRMQGERGMGGPIYGDVLCSDGVYLPHVWESDFHTSFDGRWIRTGSYGESTPRLLDRKSRRSWLLSVAEAGLVDDLHWRLPRWNHEKTNGNGVAAESHNVLSENALEAWLSKHVGGKAQALTGVCDLWIPADCVPASAQAQPPAIAHQDNAVVQVTVQRHWPASLRDLDQPLEPLHHPQWQLQLNGEPHSWIIDGQSPLVWRPDGQAFACYGYPANNGARTPTVRLGAWSLALGGQQWPELMPQDRKPWTVLIDSPDDTSPGQPALRWDGVDLMQRMQVDTPELERLHDGRSLRCVVSTLHAVSQHYEDGRFALQSIPKRHFWWRRDLLHPTQWVAQSEVVAGERLVWSLVHEANDELGATAAYSIQWGDQPLPGLWELEHLVVQNQWALLTPATESPLQGGKPVPWVWDGKQLNAIEMGGAVLRMRPHVLPGRAQLLVMVGCGPDNSNLASSGLWRWPLQVADATNLTKNGWTPAYEWRDVAVNAQGVWQLQARWREVQQVQHPCADGDYVWQHAAAQDAVWWWGGLHQGMNNDWKPKAPRCEGVLVTQTAAVLCGVGPSVCPHHAGDGWLSLEWLARGTNAEAHHWKLHWLRPLKHELWTLELRAYMPILQGWDAVHGVQWSDTAVPETGTDDTPTHVVKTVQHVIAPMRWERAQLEVLKQSPVGLWVRKQDAVYVDAMVLRDDWPWVRETEPSSRTQQT